VGSHRSALRSAARIIDDDAPVRLALRETSRAASAVALPFSGVVAGLVAAVLLKDRGVTAQVSGGVGVALLVALSGQLKLWASLLRGFGSTRMASLFEGRSGGAAAALCQAALLLGVTLAAKEAGLGWTLLLAGAGYVVPVIAAGWMLRKFWRPDEVPRLRRGLRRLLTDDWAFASAQLTSYVHANLELWLAGLLLSSVDASLFGAADRLVLLLAVPLTALQVVFAPAIARLGATDPALAERILRTGATLATAVTAIGWIPMLLAPGFLLDVVYGPGFDEAEVALVILTVGYVANVTTGLASIALAMTGREYDLARILWACVGCRAVLAVAGASLGGVDGLAIAEALSTMIMVMAIWRSSRKLTGLSTQLTLHPDIRVLRRTAA
jgi:O-antigen/teichoic acid export membrane protein